MSAEVLQSSDVTTAAQDAERLQTESRRDAGGWNPENFAREQILGLARQVFFSNTKRPVRQVAFSALEPETDLRSLCRGVGEALALQTPATVAVVGGYPRLLQGTDARREQAAERGITGDMPLRQIAARVRGNLWLVPDARGGSDSVTAASLHLYLGEVRRQFEYSIVQAPPVGGWDAVAAMAQFADGIVLVLSAQRTRRAAARKIKAALEAAQARILGTVLSDRSFPIPEAIYRRL
jgi:receptor protein-tyrosine kinase